MAVSISPKLAVALAVSLALHGMLVVAVRTQPASATAVLPSTLQAWIEPVAPGVAELERTESITPEPAAESAPSVAAPSPTVAATEPAATTPAPQLPSPPLANARTDAPEPGLVIPLLPDPTYHPISALDIPPRLLGDSDACFPHGATGEVAYVLLIDEAGTVDQASIADVKPQGLFTAAAVEMCGKLKFTPGIRDGRPVRSRVRFVVGTGAGAR